MNLSLADTYISSEKYKSLNTNANEVYENLWSILFHPLLMKTVEERESVFVEWDKSYARAFRYAIMDDETKYYCTNYSKMINWNCQYIEIEKRVCFNFILFLYH